MKRILLDTNIYGELVIDPEIDVIKTGIKKKPLVIYGNRLIRKELRMADIRSLRLSLLSLYDEIAKKEYEIDDNMKNIANSYYKAYREFGGSKSKDKIINDFIIVACATVHILDIVVSEDEKSMLIENVIRSYNLVNDIIKKITPQFIGYEKFKEMLGG